MTADAKPIVRVAFSNDGGKTFAAPLTVDAINPIGRGDATFLPDGTLLIAWYANTDDPHLAVRAYARDLRQSSPLRVASVAGSRRSGRPRIVASSNDAIVVWTSNHEGRPMVRSALITTSK